MKLVSFRHAERESFGVVMESGIADVGKELGSKYRSLRAVLEAGALGEIKEMVVAKSADLSFNHVTFLPVIPDADKVLAIGRNYKAHIAEAGRDIPEHPRVFLKHMSAIVGHEEAIVRPRVSGRFDYEGELAVIMGRRGRHIDKAEALSYVAGYSCFNDGSVRDFQEHSLAAGKNFPKSSAFGPWMTTTDEIPDPAGLLLMTRLNGQEVQKSGTNLLIFDIPFLISYLSSWTELLPGDTIATGTPGGVGSRRNPPLWMKPGDTIEVEISGIGVLRNSVVGE